MKTTTFKLLLTIIVAVIFTASMVKIVLGADYVNVTSVTPNKDGSTSVSIERTQVNNNTEYPMLYYTYTFKDKLNLQNAIDKVSLFVDDHITVRSKTGESVAKQGQTWALAKKRSEAWQTGGLKGYWEELNRQIAEQGLK